MSWEIRQGDWIDVLRTLPDESVQCCVTSPPYWSLRVYGNQAEVGGEDHPLEYVEKLSVGFRELRRVLRADGCLLLNLGDSYAASGKGGGGCVWAKREGGCWEGLTERTGFRMPPPGYKMKDLTLTPFMVADRLRCDGWYLRSVVIWRKPSAVEPLRLDRPAVSHEYVFLLAKSEMYAAYNPGESWWGHSVWNISSQPCDGHTAAMPEELARRCIVIGSRPGETVIDPFSGAGTTAVVSARLGRNFVGIELYTENVAIAEKRLAYVEAQPQLFEPTAEQMELGVPDAGL